MDRHVCSLLYKTTWCLVSCLFVLEWSPSVNSKVPWYICFSSSMNPSGIFRHATNYTIHYKELKAFGVWVQRNLQTYNSVRGREHLKEEVHMR
jgi:hypothetical protein